MTKNYINTNRKKNFLFTSTSLSIVFLALLPKFAQSQTIENNIENGETVVITGSARQIQADIIKRKNSDFLIDSISSDDIGEFPDITIAESLRRITGVTTIYNDDIGQFASIRGIHPEMVPVTINGLTIATTGDLGEGTRMVNLQVIPSLSVKSLEVYKTPLANIDAGSLGGLINIEPVSAFNKDAKNLIINLGLSYSSYMDVPDDNSWGDSKDSPYGGSISILANKKFGKNKDIGIAFGFIYDDRPRTQSNYSIVNRLYYTNTGAATNPLDTNWNGIGVPDSFLQHNYTNKFHKHGATLRLQYKPTEKFNTGIYAYGFYADEQETRNTNRVYQLSTPQALTLTSGTMKVGSSDTQWRYNTFERTQYGIQWETNIKTSDKSKLSTNMGYSFAEFYTDRNFVSFIYRPAKNLSYDFNNKEKKFTLVDEASYLNPNNFVLGQTYHDFRNTKEDVFEARIDYDYNNSKNAKGFGFALGANYRNLDMRRDNNAINYVTGGLKLTGIGSVQNFSTIGYPVSSLWINPDIFWNNSINSVTVNSTTSKKDSIISDYRYKEDLFAAYLIGSYIGEKYKASLGLKADYIESDATFPKTIGGILQENFYNKSSNYYNTLPYLNINYNLSSNFRLKLSASKSLGRPNPEDIASAETVDATNLILSRGNPDIKPKKSDNFDLGLEYYFNNGKGMITLTGFHKTIKDDIINTSVIEEIDGQNWTISQPINGEETKMNGFEFGFLNNSFANINPILKNFGFSTNLLLVEGETAYIYNNKRIVTDDLLWMSDVSANGSIFYNFGKGTELRFAANYKSGYKEELAANPWQDLYIEPFTTYDITFNYALNKNLSIRLEGRNITDNNRIRTTGLNHEYSRAELEIGKTFFARIIFTK